MQLQHLRPLLHLQNCYCPAGCNISLTDILSHTSVHNYRLQLWAGLSGWGRTAGLGAVGDWQWQLWQSRSSVPKDPCLAFLRCTKAKFKISTSTVLVLLSFESFRLGRYSSAHTHKRALESEFKPPRALKTIKLASKRQTSSQKVCIRRMKGIEGCCRKAAVLAHWLKGERTFCRWWVSLAAAFFSAQISNKERRLKRQKGRWCWRVWALKQGPKSRLRTESFEKVTRSHCVSSREWPACSESDKTTKGE